MANFVTVAYGLVTRESSTSGEKPALSTSEDPWIDVSALNPRPVIGDHYDGVDFTLDHTSLTAAQGAKVAALRDLCAYHIKYLGFNVHFTEDAPNIICYIYPSEAKDQSNVHAINAAASGHLLDDDPPWTGSLWCGITPDGTGRMVDGTQWDKRDHTVSKIQQVCHVMFHHIEDAQDELKAETDAVLAATTVNDVNAVTWVPPAS